MNDLLQNIAKDLNIYKYENESIEEYGNRIIYCSLSAWAKVQILNSSYIDINKENEDYPCTSQRYITEKLKRVSEGLIKTIPNTDLWIQGRNLTASNKGISQYIIEQLNFCYQLSKIKNQYFTAIPERIIYFSNNELILGGTNWNSKLKNAFSVGVGVWRNKRDNHNSNYKEIFNIPQCSLYEYYKSIEKNTLWKLDELDENYEYFCGGKGLWHNKAWNTFNTKYVPQGISLFRKKDSKSNYGLLYHKENEIFTAKLDEWYILENEIYRIMYALEYYREKPAEFKAKRKGEMIQLHCHSNLPNAENRVLLMASWPQKTYDDIFFRNVPETLWKDVEEVLGGLGIKIIFE